MTACLSCFCTNVFWPVGVWISFLCPWDCFKSSINHLKKNNNINKTFKAKLLDSTVTSAFHQHKWNKNPFLASCLMTWGYPAHQRFWGRPTGSWWSRSATAVNNHRTGLKQRPRKTTWYTYDISGWAVLELTPRRIINHQPSFVSRDRVRMSAIIWVCVTENSGTLSCVTQETAKLCEFQIKCTKCQDWLEVGAWKQWPKPVPQTSREDVVVRPNTTASSTSLELHS